MALSFVAMVHVATPAVEKTSHLLRTLPDLQKGSDRKTAQQAGRLTLIEDCSPQVITWSQ